MTDDLITRRARTEPTISGYRCLGLISHHLWPDWPEWVFLRVKPKRGRRRRVSGGKLARAAAPQLRQTCANARGIS